jgi:hypothetical protein
MTTQISLRHTLAIVAYRAGRTIESAPAAFSGCRAGEGSRSGSEILAHISDLLDWALSLARGAEQWNDSTPLEWAQETARFYRTLKALDDYVASAAELRTPAAQIFQGAVADALTHVGQLALLRRLAGEPIVSENYSEAPIAEGQFRTVAA